MERSFPRSHISHYSIWARRGKISLSWMVVTLVNPKKQTNLTEPKLNYEICLSLSWYREGAESIYSWEISWPTQYKTFTFLLRSLRSPAATLRLGKVADMKTVSGEDGAQQNAVYEELHLIKIFANFLQHEEKKKVIYVPFKLCINKKVSANLQVILIHFQLWCLLQCQIISRDEIPRKT